MYSTKSVPKKIKDPFDGKKIKNKGGKKIKKLDMGACAFADDLPDINPDHPAMRRGIMFDVDKDIDQDKKIDPVKVFENYQEPKKGGKEKNEKKIRSVKKGTPNMTYGGKNTTIKYTL
tara:strand:- start:13082 stop:13435 length:354 start_codon:yes stop_codon:yes gene_type:complete